jgi:hypothetical protein
MRFVVAVGRSLVAITFLAVAAAAGEDAAAAPPTIHVTEVPIGVVPASATDWAVSPELRRMAYVEPAPANNGVRVVVDGEPCDAFAKIQAGSLHGRVTARAWHTLPARPTGGTSS